MDQLRNFLLWREWKKFLSVPKIDFHHYNFLKTKHFALIPQTRYLKGPLEIFENFCHPIFRKLAHNM